MRPFVLLVASLWSDPDLRRRAPQPRKIAINTSRSGWPGCRAFPVGSVIVIHYKLVILAKPAN
jgi:hypothetical protein